MKIKKIIFLLFSHNTKVEAMLYKFRKMRDFHTTQYVLYFDIKDRFLASCYDRAYYKLLKLKNKADLL